MTNEQHFADDGDIKQLSLDETRSAAKQLLDSVEGDLTGDVAQRFQALTRHAEELRAEQRGSTPRVGIALGGNMVGRPTFRPPSSAAPNGSATSRLSAERTPRWWRHHTKSTTTQPNWRCCRCISTMSSAGLRRG